MAPDGQSGRTSGQHQQPNTGQPVAGGGPEFNAGSNGNNYDTDDRLITQVVIYESSSPVNEDELTQMATTEASNDISSGQLDGSSTRGSPSLSIQASPYYPSASPTLASVSSRKGDQNRPDEAASVRFMGLTTGRPGSGTGDSSAGPPATRRPFGQVATPKPPRNGSGGRQSRPKTSTPGRRCRDENDSDCDEEEDEGADSTSSSSSPSRSRDDDNDSKIAKGNNSDEDDDDGDGDNNDGANDDDTDRKASSSSKSARPDERLNEIGSGDGSGPPSDDNDDSTDDGDEPEADNSIESSGDDANTGPSQPKLFEVSTSSSYLEDNNATGGDNRALAIGTTAPNPSATPSGTTTWASAAAATTTSTATTTPSSSSARPTGAEIEVIVHSTLPKDFPTSGLGAPAASTGSPNDQLTTPASATQSQAPDDTVRVQPIYPSSTTSDSSSLDNSADGATSTPLDDSDPPTPQTVGLDDPLNKFMPIPPPSQRLQFESSLHRGAGTQDNGAGAGQGAGGGGNNVNEQQINTFPIKRPQLGSSELIGGGWSTRRPYVAGARPLLGDDLSASSNNNNQQQHQQQPFKQSFSSAHASSGNLGSVQAGKQPKHGADILPTILYASIAVLIMAVLIIVLIGVVFWHKNALRRRALIQKAHLMNGRAHHHQQQPMGGGMVASMSHASQLMQQQAPAPMGQMHQQPGLLSTYAPGKGLSAAQKVTSSLVKLDEEEGARQFSLDTGEQRNIMLLDDELGEQSGNRQANHQADNGQLLDRTQQQSQQHQHQQQTSNERQLNNRSSWSTEDPITTTSSGSQRTQEDGISQQHQHQQSVQAQHQNPMHSSQYPNSLSDGRQNSSSISDSQCSPDPSVQQQHLTGTSGPEGCQPPLSDDQHYQQQQLMMGLQQQQQQHPPVAPRGAVQVLSVRGRYAAPGQGSPMVMMMQPQHNQNGNEPMMAKYSPSGFMDSTSDSFDSIKQQLNRQPAGARLGPVHPNDLSSTEPGQQQVPYGPRGPSGHGHVGLFEDHHSGQFHGPPNGGQAGLNFTNLPSAATISPQKIAMNPLATLGRRYPPGAGLNRNIYSEDSSSFMTTSPSLARTSSSTSFAFNLAAAAATNKQLQQNQVPPIQARPLIDPAGRIINDYTQSKAFAGDQSLANGSGPPVLGRKDRSEAWYV